MMSVNSISSISPGCAPFTNTGPVSGCTAPASSVAKSATVVRRRDLAIERIARFQRDLLALADLHHRGDVRMIAVMAAVRLVAEPLAPIDADGVHGGCSFREVCAYARAGTDFATPSSRRCRSSHHRRGCGDQKDGCRQPDRAGARLGGERGLNLLGDHLAELSRWVSSPRSALPSVPSSARAALLPPGRRR